MDYKYTAIIIEPRKHKALHFVLNNMLECLPKDWKIILFHGINNEEYSIEQTNNLNESKERIQLIKLDIVNLNQKTYSELLANRLDIYNYIETEYFLIFQTDSMMFKQNAHLLESFLNNDYDYIGAPWLITNYWPTKERDFIGNGGFSLRKKDKMIEIIQNNKWDENSEWHEDLFFTKKRDGIEIKKPVYEKALTFCVDETFSPLTMACHRPWVTPHYPEFVKLYPECEQLKNLQEEKM
jgi:hypothetical protein